MPNTFLRFSFVLPALSLLNCHQGGVASAAPPAPEQLVAEATISGNRGRAFLPVTINGQAVTFVINMENARGISLSTDALARAGITLADTTQLDSLTIGPVVERHVLLHLMPDPGSVNKPQGLPPVVGVIGIRFLAHYDVVYDSPAGLVRLYAFPPNAVGSGTVWLPPGVRPTDCGRMLPVPTGIQYPPFTGVALQLEGRSVTGVIEMGQYIPKMNQAAANTLGLTPDSPNMQPNQGGDQQDLFGNPVKYKATNIHLAVGSNTFWVGPVEIMQKLGVDDSLPPNTPVMLMNLVNLRHVVLFNSMSSRQVCLSRPTPMQSGP